MLPSCPGVQQNLQVRDKNNVFESWTSLHERTSEPRHHPCCALAVTHLVPNCDKQTQTRKASTNSMWAYLNSRFYFPNLETDTQAANAIIPAIDKVTLTELAKLVQCAGCTVLAQWLRLARTGVASCTIRLFLSCKEYLHCSHVRGWTSLSAQCRCYGQADRSTCAGTTVKRCKLRFARCRPAKHQHGHGAPLRWRGHRPHQDLAIERYACHSHKLMARRYTIT